MNDDERLAIAAAQLDRVLGFFSRVDSKASALFAINAALMTILCLNLTATDLRVWYIVAPGFLAIGLLLASIYFIYRSAFPSLSGGHRSLIYFREIAKKTEANYVEDFGSVDRETLTKDLIGQVWRNSEILKMKFDAVKVAFILTVISVLPWTLFLIFSSLHHGSMPSIR